MTTPNFGPSVDLVSKKTGSSFNILSNIKIIWKMNLMLIFMSLGLIGVMVIGIQGLNVLRYHLSNIYDFMLIPIVAINKADTALANAQIQLEVLRDPTLSSSNQTASFKTIQAADTKATEVIARYDKEWVTTVSPEFTAVLRELGRLDLQADETATLSALHTAYNNYLLAQDAYVTSIQSGTSDDQLANSALNRLIETRQYLQHLIEVNNKFAELSNQAAVSAYTQGLINMGLVFGLTLCLSLTLSYLIVRSITKRLSSLIQSTIFIMQGNLEQPITVIGRDEIGLFATALNLMTTQLRDLIGSLEQQAQRLEIVASLGERLSAILKLEELLPEVVNRIKENFGYYHTHVYLLDDQDEKLVIAEGTGLAGAEMKAERHSIALNAPTSFVARAARTGEIVKVDNVHEAKDWLPNPLLPDTNSEMAVPIIVEGQVVGVLDVQEDEIAGLDEDDVNLLRSLASQVAVAIRNARLFAEVETALTEARATQEQYQEQSWDRAKNVARKGQYTYVRPDAPAPDETALTAVKQQALAQNRPVVLTVNQANQAASFRSIIAPIILRNTPIGAVEIHPAQAEQVWSEGDLAIVEAIARELSLAAENLRLFEETREQASREQTIREITDKLQAAPTLDLLLETAARELGQHLGVRHTVLELGINSPSIPSSSSEYLSDHGREST